MGAPNRISSTTFSFRNRTVTPRDPLPDVTVCKQTKYTATPVTNADETLRRTPRVSRCKGESHRGPARRLVARGESDANRGTLYAEERRGKHVGRGTQRTELVFELGIVGLLPIFEQLLELFRGGVSAAVQDSLGRRRQNLEAPNFPLPFGETD
jgi:hypothetical protein